MTNRFRKSSRTVLTSASVLALCVVSGQAYAQESAQSDSDFDANAIVVTANLREQTLEEVPLAVSVVSGERLDAVGVGGIEAITDTAPSLTFTKGDNPSNSSLSIRGIGTSAFSVAVEPAVSVVVDGVVMARAGQGFQDLIDVKRVEVLRGPQSTLFGKNASAGLISVTTEDPSDYLTGKVDASLAEGGEYSVRGSVSGPLSETTGLRLSGFYKQFDGFIDNVSGIGDDKRAGYENYGFRGKLRFEPSSDLNITLIGDYRSGFDNSTFTMRKVYSDAYRNALAPVVPSAENRTVNINAPTDNNTEQWGASGKIEYDFADNWQLTSITAYREWSFSGNSDVDATSLTQPVQGVNLWDVNSGNTDLSQKSQELRFASGDLGGFDILFGGFAFRLNADRSFLRRQQFANGTNRSGQFNGSTETTNLAAFISTNIYLGDTTEMFGGLRLIHEKLEYEAFRDPANVLVPGDVPLGGAAGTAVDFAGSTTDTSVVGKIGIRQQVSDFGNVYASYARGYKGKGFNLIFATQESYEPVDAEKSDAFEIGAKLTTLDRSLSLNLAAFYTKYKNFQGQAQIPGDVAFLLLNAGEVSTKGIEAEASFTPTDLTTLSLGATFLDAQIDEYPLGPCYLFQTEAEGCVNGVQDLTGGDLPNAPDVRLTGFVKQVIPFGDSLPFDGFVQSNFVYQSKVQFGLDQDPTTRQKGYGVVNAALGLESKDDRYSLTFFVRNIFDQNYAGYIFSSGFNGGRVYQQVVRDASRYVGVKASYSF
ncbi:TonB-dependent receptor [Altericroceibacterium endophyticum]|uniref:TonB-dependent receptor n=1 Tax=Altericroceibacterium endophyticum TaxID=1808508 RepID=A0A6I4T5E1_9SPHN|nr:TonB-dependent receptor [Altericroceibacterium endophyticum]MXO64945.1 TonB-dependent receptor [Altericroceibacterium endophyticum]